MSLASPVPILLRIGSTAASNASLLATNLLNGSDQGNSTLRVFFASGSGSIFTAVMSDGTNTKEIDFNEGGSTVASSGYWWTCPLFGSSRIVSGATRATAGINFKLRDNTSSTATYTLILDECPGEMI